jgi:enoyl-CoA hydratase/carnithine racemase
MPRLERDDEVFVLSLDDGDNRFHPDWLTAVESALDEVDSATGARAMVTTGSGKFWSNGLDTDWLAANEAQRESYLDRVHLLFARTLASPVGTVAALNGHTFAAGALWALAHDLRVMRTDRGYYCLPEVDLGLTFRRGATELVRARLAAAVTHEALTTGRRYDAKAALAAGIVDAVEDADALRGAAVELARSLAAKATPNRAEIKETLYADALAALRTAAAPTGAVPPVPSNGSAYRSSTAIM